VQRLHVPGLVALVLRTGLCWIPARRALADAAGIFPPLRLRPRCALAVGGGRLHLAACAQTPRKLKRLTRRFGPAARSAVPQAAHELPRVDAVLEGLAPFDENDGHLIVVAALQFGILVNIDFAQQKRRTPAELAERLFGFVTQMAALARVEHDLR